MNSKIVIVNKSNDLIACCHKLNYIIIHNMLNVTNLIPDNNNNIYNNII